MQSQRTCSRCQAPLIPHRNGHGLCMRCYQADWRIRNHEAVSAKERDYYATHREERLAYAIAHRVANRAEINARQRAFTMAHPEKRRAQHAAWYATHREQVRAYKAAYYAARRAEHAARRRTWYLRNRDVAITASRAYVRANPEQVRAYQAAHYAANRDHYAAYTVAYRRARPEVHREIGNRRRARKRAGFVAPVDAQAIYARDKGICQLCGKPVKRAEASMDHVVPFAHGGTHEPRNVQLAHLRCNIRRGHRGPAQTRMF